MLLSRLMRALEWARANHQKIIIETPHPRGMIIVPFDDSDVSGMRMILDIINAVENAKAVGGGR